MKRTEKIVVEHKGENRKERRWGMIQAYRQPGKKTRSYAPREFIKQMIMSRKP